MEDLHVEKSTGTPQKQSDKQENRRGVIGNFNYIMTKCWRMVFNWNVFICLFLASYSMDTILLLRMFWVLDSIKIKSKLKPKLKIFFAEFVIDLKIKHRITSIAYHFHLPNTTSDGDKCNWVRAASTTYIFFYF